MPNERTTHPSCWYVALQSLHIDRYSNPNDYQSATPLRLNFVLQAFRTQKNTTLLKIRADSSNAADQIHGETVNKTTINL